MKLRIFLALLALCLVTPAAYGQNVTTTSATAINLNAIALNAPQMTLKTIAQNKANSDLTAADLVVMALTTDEAVGTMASASDAEDISRVAQFHITPTLTAADLGVMALTTDEAMGTMASANDAGTQISLVDQSHTLTTGTLASLDMENVGIETGPLAMTGGSGCRNPAAGSYIGATAG